MILTCPNCATRYLVDPAAIGVDGRQVRCANCSHEWFETAPENLIQPEPEFEPAIVSPAPGAPEPQDMSALAALEEAEAELAAQRRRAHRANLPAVVDEPKVPVALIGAFCAMLLANVLIAGFTYHRSVMKYLPFTQGIYSIFGLYPTQGLMLTDVQFSKQIGISAPVYKVDCKIINTTQKDQVIPGMLVSLLDIDGKVITSQKESSNEGKPVAAGSRISCDQIKIELNARSKDAQKIRLDIGDAYDLFIRP